MLDSKGLTFSRGAKLGLPIGLGYFSVSLAFGIMAVGGGLPLWAPLLTSMTNFTGTGQFAGIQILINNGSILEIAFTVLMINIRYFLMALSVAQKIPKEVGLGKRLLIAFGMTDENFAVIYSQTARLTFPFMMGVITTSYVGWIGGTLVGALLQNVIPEMLTAALGIMIYAMFVAIVTPAARQSLAVLGTIGIAVAISCIFRFTPYLKEVPSGWVYIIAGIISGVIMAIVKPYKDVDSINQLDEQEDDSKPKIEDNKEDNV